MKKFLGLIFVMFFAFVLVGCGGESGGTTLQTITINGKSTLNVGDEVTYTVKFVPEDFENQKVNWSVSDETVISVDASGKVTAKAKGSAYLYATSEAQSNVQGKKRIAVKDNDGGDEPEYPNLQGYTIRIAQAETNLADFDPFLEAYAGADKEAKQQAWRDVEELFNCTIEVAAYPASAEWGPSRWNYILNQAQVGISDYDFLTVPDSKIPTFVEGGALISMEDFYVLHGNNMMDPSWITSGSYQGKLYSFNTGVNNIYNVMYYNIGLLEKLQEYNEELQEPAQIFLDGNWTFDKFEAYCQEVQDTMAQAFGEEGTAGSANQGYFAVSGWDSYWWVGLASNDGEPLADTTAMTVNIDTPHKMQAADVVKNLYTKKLAASAQSVDQNVTQWNEGKALFNTGDLWFVGADNRWSKDLWGEDTRYGYVPWPRANDVEFDEIQVALGGTATWVMPIGRDYEPYGEECTAENIYWAIAELYKRTDEIHKSSPDYDEVTIINNEAAKFAHSQASQEAYKYMKNLIKAGKGYFDPLVTSDNSVGSLYTNSASRQTIKGAVTQYCATGAVGTWEEAIAALKPILQESLRKAFS